MNIPVVCSLQDEDVWVDVMTDKYRKEVWQLMGERGDEVDAFISVSDYYAAEIRKKMTLRNEQLFTVHLGVDPTDYFPENITRKEPVIGYLSRLCEENGLAVLVDAFILLRQDKAFETVKLKLTGGNTADDIHFIKEQKTKIAKAGLEKMVLWLDDIDLEERQAFFDTVTLISVPVLHGEAFGLYQLEAMASGIPMVQPSLGAFPEVIGLTGGGLTYSPNDAASLAQALGSVIQDAERLRQMSDAGIAGVQKHFDIHEQARKLVRVYEHVMQVQKGKSVNILSSGN
jgi:glycosyltransferase involved in cell wall biosynthesis